MYPFGLTCSKYIEGGSGCNVPLPASLNYTFFEPITKQIYLEETDCDEIL